jgi:hypothetical protein
VEKLHGSRTPAWRNLRGRGLQKKQSYFEGPEDEDDELQDQPSEGEEEEEGALDDAVALDEEEDGGSSEASGGRKRLPTSVLLDLGMLKVLYACGALCFCPLAAGKRGGGGGGRARQ